MNKYEPIRDEILALPSTILDEDRSMEYKLIMWIFINRLLYGLDWENKYYAP